MPPSGYDAVLLVSFGGPEGPDDVGPFLENVTGGRGIPPERLREVADRYLAVGGASPINDQCRRIRAELEAALDAAGLDLPVYWGNRNWHPMLSATLADMAGDGVRRALALVTSAYSSYSGCRQYLEDIEAARREVGPGAPVVDKIRAYHDHPGFVVPFADAVREARQQLPGPVAESARLVATAHSIPLSMAEVCDYEEQLGVTAGSVAAAAGFDGFDLAWQSRSGPPSVPWLEPDICDHIRSLAERDVAAVVVAPIGFVSDHMEVVWDLDVEAAAVAAEVGVAFARATSPGTGPDPRFVDMLVELVRERLDPSLPRRALGPHGPRPDSCPDGCCVARDRRPVHHPSRGEP